MVTGFFALLGFIAVPIGERTGYEHVNAALSTPEGREAVTAVARAYGALRERIVGWAVERLQTSVDPKAYWTVGLAMRWTTTGRRPAAVVPSSVTTKKVVLSLGVGVVKTQVSYGAKNVEATPAPIPMPLL
jgi:hypothetical protein